MSDSESSAEKIIHKRRRVQGDSASRPGNICSSCLAFQTECTHLSTKKKRGPPKGTPRGQKAITSIIRAINSAGQIYEPPTDIAAVKQLIVGIAGYAQHLEEENARLRDHPSSSNLSVMASADGNSDELQAPPGSYLDIDAHAVDGLIEHMKELKVHSARDRFFGGSSSLMLLQTAISVKNEYTGENSEMNSFQLQPPQGDKGGSVSADSCKRPEFWVIHPWQVIPLDNPPPFHFPDADLIDSLVSLYFSNVNVYFPILHKPTFSRSVSENLHLNDRHLGALLLAVCALGARFSDDDRVYEDGVLGPNGENRGQARVEQSVYVFFMQATSTPESCWILVSIGVRFIQDVGAHRMKQDHLNKPTVENEVWKRAFWMLYVMDICISAFLGRPRSITHEDFDVDLPINVDDEYWENPDDPENTFQQPEGKPTMRSYFVSLIKLLDILGYAMRTIYAVRRTDIWTVKGMSGVEWNEKIVAELDSSLNKWLEEIPAHSLPDNHFSYPQTHLVSQALGMQFSSSSAEETFTLNLPTYSRDLGNLPIYESFTNFDLSMFDETPYDSLESSPLQAAELSAQKLGGLGLITELGPQPFALTSDDNLFSQPNLNDVSLNQGDSLPGFYSDTRFGV
ncbi:hypothetical protein D9757_006690 [Collybiopsis confluens]|uniref:Xylanolytic transcriptional activator regulatory domain-containing protein n=1 Tax=Collybiopsis confluens TaxID=2823264 RepID=A0A8H5HNK1_9AGAR|nr:hypothetical protein D9757_006690 [Collybiopsis confluens]